MLCGWMITCVYFEAECFCFPCDFISQALPVNSKCIISATNLVVCLNKDFPRKKIGGMAGYISNSYDYIRNFWCWFMATKIILDSHNLCNVIKQIITPATVLTVLNRCRSNHSFLSWLNCFHLMSYESNPQSYGALWNFDWHLKMAKKCDKFSLYSIHQNP